MSSFLSSPKSDTISTPSTLRVSNSTLCSIPTLRVGTCLPHTVPNYCPLVRNMRLLAKNHRRTVCYCCKVEKSSTSVCSYCKADVCLHDISSFILGELVTYRTHSRFMSDMLPKYSVFMSVDVFTVRYLRKKGSPRT